MQKPILLFLLMSIVSVSLPGCYRMRASSGGGQEASFSGIRKINTADIAVPDGYIVEAVAQGLTFPTAATEDDKGNLYVIEAGYAYGEVWLAPRLLRINANGSQTEIAAGTKNGPWTGVTYHKGNFYVAEGGSLEGGKILRINLQGEITPLIENLPTLGDHHTNGPVIGTDNSIYFSLGTATNAGVVGPDNADFGWLSRRPDFHDIPCEDIVLSGKNYETANPLTPGDPEDVVSTGAFVPFGTKTTEKQTIKGKVPCSGAVLKMPLDGGTPELVAWGFRNPFGMALSPDGQLYITENSFDVRGSRPVWGTGDYLYRVEQGAWYGWPDYAGGKALKTREFDMPGGDPPVPLLDFPPSNPPRPVAELGVHSSSNGLDFSRSDDFGYKGQAFIAQFGDMAPKVGKVLKPVGFKVVRIDTNKGTTEDFAANKGKVNGPATWLKGGGLERPVSVKFSADGRSLYITDFGVMLVDKEGPSPKEKTGVIWKVTKKDGGQQR